MIYMKLKWYKKYDSVYPLCITEKAEYVDNILDTVELLLRMYCIDTEALVFVFNGGSSYSFTIHPIFIRICML